MPNDPRTQIYLQTPAQLDLQVFPDLLASVLDAAEIACLRLTTFGCAQDDIKRRADILRDVAHSRDISLVIDTHYRMVQPLGLDGVHLLDGTKQIREARKALGKDGIIGAFCGSSRHIGMSAAEMTADYVAFGPMLADPLLGDGSIAELDLLQWWSEMIEVPLVAEGRISLEKAAELAHCADFISLSDEVWLNADGPVAAIVAYAARLT